MASCEMCGKKTTLMDTIIEGSILKVCPGCSKFGNAIEIKKPVEQQRANNISFQRHKPKIISQEKEIINSNCGQIIKRAREKAGMKQEDVAKSIGEKSSVIQKIETGNLEPTLKLTKKFEQFFNLRLIEKKEEESPDDEIKELNMNDENVTIGDLIKFKKQ